MEARPHPDVSDPIEEWGEKDYLSLPDDRGVELSDSCLVFLPQPNEEHQIILGRLYLAFADFVGAQKLGLVLMAAIPVRLWKDKIRQPDVVFRSQERPRGVDGHFWDGADLAVEIVSPEGRNRDHHEKREEYAKAGISEYWIVDPEERSIQNLVLEGDQYRLLTRHVAGDRAASVLLPGLTVSVEALIAAEQ